ncbi:hemicentin-2-like isoform X2 [Tachypleus tridentatus]|uniref:hemicentin-2-like isoform X2 n=1 Tax=Tachypleus tridentatus TaxID=6853 RepID=UPI003FD26B6B
MISRTRTVSMVSFEGLCLVMMCITPNCWLARHTDIVEDSEFVVTGLVGEKADLPCNVDVGACGDVYFVTWTKNVSNEWKRLYLYSEPVEKPLQELANPDRADFYVHDSSAYLRISPLKIEDEGNYKCDVTYVQGKCPSLSYASLTTMAKPSQPVIKKDGKELETSTVIGPVYEGASFSFECVTFGGKPLPEVSWLKNGNFLLGETIVQDDKFGPANVTSTVRIVLSRNDLGARLSCQVKNKAIENFLISWIDIDLHVKPSSMIVEGPLEPLIEGDRVTLSCTIVGAKPAANATWYNRSETIVPQPQADIKPGSTGSFNTVSNLEIIVSRYDNKGVFYCKGSNPVLEKNGDPPLLKSIGLEVMYPPVVQMQPQSGITIRESEDATVMCTFDANPVEVYDVIWFKEGVQLSTDNENRFQITNRSHPALVIRNMTRSDSGMYSCRLSNKIGRGARSKDIEIIVVYQPVVDISVSPAIVNENDGSTVLAKCLTVQGNPRALLRVRWYKNDFFFNETTENHIEFQNIRRESTANYSCEAKNVAGWSDRSPPRRLQVNYVPGPATIVQLNFPAVKGHPVTFECLVEDLGSPLATQFRWEHNGVLIHNVLQNCTTGPLSLDTRGNYTCAAVNEVGKGPTGFLHLTVTAPPSLVVGFPHIHGAPSDISSLSISCRIECDPLCEIEWLRDGDSIMDSDRFFVKTRVLPEDLLTNRFKSVVSTLHWNFNAWPGGALNRKTDNSEYTCRSSKNIAGPGVTTSTFFKVQYPPENITVSRSYLEVVEGDLPDKIYCTANSWPPSEYIWKFSNLIISYTSELSFNNSISRENTGFYECVASNRLGQKSAKIHINVVYKPECIVYEKKNKNERTTLTCEVQANPPLVNFTWLKDNQTFEESAVSHGTRSVLTLSDASSKYFGTYYCVASNSIGESVPCSTEVTGFIGTAGWVPDFGDENIIIVAAVVAAVAVLFIVVVIVIITILKRRRMRNESKQALKERKNMECRGQSDETTSISNPNFQPSFVSNGSPTMRRGNSDATGPKNRTPLYQNTENGQAGTRPIYENTVFSQRAYRGVTGITNDGLVYADLSLPNCGKLPTFGRGIHSDYAMLQFSRGEELPEENIC